MLGSFPPVVPLVLHSSISYLGFFVSEGSADVIREFATIFATEAAVLAGRRARPLAPTGPVSRTWPLCVWGCAHCTWAPWVDPKGRRYAGHSLTQ